MRFGLPFLSRVTFVFLVLGFLSPAPALLLLLLLLAVEELPFIMLGLMTEGMPPLCMLSAFISLRSVDGRGEITGAGGLCVRIASHKAGEVHSRQSHGEVRRR